MGEIEEIREVLDKNIVIGSEQALKSLKKGNVEKVFVTSNCSLRIKQEIEKYAQLQKVEVKSLEMPNEELGVVCKKPFSISVLTVLKGK